MHGAVEGLPAQSQEEELHQTYMQKMAAYALHLLQGAPQLPGIPRICAAVSNAVEQPGEVFLEVVTFLEETMSSSLVCAGGGDR